MLGPAIIRPLTPSTAPARTNAVDRGENANSAKPSEFTRWPPITATCVGSRVMYVVTLSSQVMSTTDDSVRTALYRLVGYPSATTWSGSALMDWVYVSVPSSTATR